MGKKWMRTGLVATMTSAAARKFQIVVAATAALAIKAAWDHHITADEAYEIVGAALVSLGVYGTTNKPPA